MKVSKSVDDLRTSQSIEGRDFHDFEMLDAKIASALKKIITDWYLRRRVDVERAEWSKIRQISSRKTDCLYDLRTFSSLLNNHPSHEKRGSCAGQISAVVGVAPLHARARREVLEAAPDSWSVRRTLKHMEGE